MTDLARGVQPPAVGDESFDEYYYAHCCGDPYERSEALLAFFGGIADRLVADVAPKSVLDAGCAIGLLVEALRARGVDASGVDLSSYAIGKADESVRAHCRHGSIADELPARYDLIVSIEVLEHMPARAAEAAIANFCRHTDDVVFSSSPLDYKEPTHINVHPPEYWASEFARHGFYRDVDFDASYITPWAARFRRSAEPIHRIVRDYERRFWALTLERNDTRAYSMQVQGELAGKLRQIADLEQQRIAADAESRRARDAAAATRITLQTELGRAQIMAGAERRRAEAAAAESARTLAEKNESIAKTQSALARSRTELAQARDRIFHMERSLFWRVRSLFRRS